MILKCDLLVSKLAFIFNLYRYAVDSSNLWMYLFELVLDKEWSTVGAVGYGLYSRCIQMTLSACKRASANGI